MKLDSVAPAFRSASLSALLYTPEGVPGRDGIVFAHGFTASKHGMDGIAAYHASRGYTCLTYDCVGHKLGATGGMMQSVQDAVDCLSAAVGWLEERCEGVSVVGHSMGAGAALRVVAEAEESGRPLSAAVCMCIGPEPLRGFEGAIGRQMLALRSDYVAGAPPEILLGEIGTLVPDAARIRHTPVLFIAARSDVLLKPRHVREVADQCRTAEFREVDAQHMDAPDRARAVVLQWLDGVVRER